MSVDVVHALEKKASVEVTKFGSRVKRKVVLKKTRFTPWNIEFSKGCVAVLLDGTLPAELWVTKEITQRVHSEGEVNWVQTERTCLPVCAVTLELNVKGELTASKLTVKEKGEERTLRRYTDSEGNDMFRRRKNSVEKSWTLEERNTAGIERKKYDYNGNTWVERYYY
ncbi:MAG: hypothetical protein CMA10_04775 [Euryarchaeota archaeon]|nr:hypothetical protein [Euryarchaeota archaeon]|tara:strand:- start:2110 stop:2613 length:504 start_codon:yes stop_codon:yes gene_type:complete